MKSQHTLIAVILSVLALSTSFGVKAQDATPESTGTASEQANVTVTVPKLVASPDVSTTFIFPSSATKQFVLGKPVPIVINFANNGNNVFNVTRVHGAFVHPQDQRYLIQNFTRQIYNQVVQPSEHRSLLYTFFPDPQLEPRDYPLLVSVYYSDSEGANFTSAVYNSTIHLIESNEPLDLTTLFTYVGVLGVAGLVGFLVYQNARGAPKRKIPRTEYGTQKTTVVDNEWLEGTAAARSPKVKRDINVVSPKGQKPKKS